MLIWLATHTAQAKIASVTADAVPMARAATAFSRPVNCSEDGAAAGAGVVVGRLIVAVLIVAPSCVGAGRPVRGEPDRPALSIHYRIEYNYAS